MRTYSNPAIYRTGAEPCATMPLQRIANYQHLFVAWLIDHVRRTLWGDDMAKFNRKQIQKAAVEFLKTKESGTRWTDILRFVQEQTPETPPNSIQGAVHNLISNSSDIEKVGRGVYRLVEFGQSSDGETRGPDESASDGHSEADFYEPFAEWLTTVAGDANVAIPLGGNWLRGKWGTPDVLGVMKPLSDDLLKFDTQIVAAEIKKTPSDTVTAFGQAVAYRLFAHKSYIVVPNDTSADDTARLKALCSVHGLGLVTFDVDPSRPEFEQHVAPVLGVPDMFYANRMVHQLRQANRDTYRQLFD